MINAVVSGNLGKDAVTRQAGQTTVTGFSVASTTKRKGEKATVWVSCSLWAKRGEALCQYLTKGTRVAVAGELSTREHEGRTYLELEVSQVDLLGGGSRDQNQNPSQSRRREPEPEEGGFNDPGYGSGDDGSEPLPF